MSAAERTDFKAMLQTMSRASAEDPKVLAMLRREAVKKARTDAEWPFRASGLAKYLSVTDLELLVTGELLETPPVVLVRQWVHGVDPTWRPPMWGPTLWVNGPCGLGKTLAAGEAIGRLCPWRSDDDPRENRAARYVTFRTLMEIAKAKRSIRAAEVDAANGRLDGIVQADFVVIDEVGQELEQDKDMARLALHDVVDMRARTKALTLILCNKNAATVRERFATEWYDHRTKSRLKRVLHRDREGVGLHDLNGPDLRGEDI